MINKKIKLFATAVTVACVVFTQTSCSIVGRLKEPISKFKTATNLVTDSARSSYTILNEYSMDAALRRAQCKEINPNTSCIPTPTNRDEIIKSRIISDAGMKARLAALKSLDEYVNLLSSIVESDKPKEVGESAEKLKTSIDSLASQIAKLTKEPATTTGSAGTSATNANDAKFTSVVGLFSTAMAQILTAVAERKRSGALKKAILDGKTPVDQLLIAIRDDFGIFWAKEVMSASDEIRFAFIALTADICQTRNMNPDAPVLENCRPRQPNDPPYERPNDAELKRIREGVVAAIQARDDLDKSNPTTAVEAMQKAHTAMHTWADKPTSDNFVASMQAIESYVTAATRLGVAIVAIHEANKKKDEETETSE